MKIPYACLVCGIPFGTRFGLCPHCGPKLYDLREPLSRDDQGLQTHSLFQWRRDEWPALRSVVAKLKGKEDPEPWLELAGWLTQHRDPKCRRTLVPVPSHKANHALGFARALAHWTGWEIAEPLIKKASQENKTLSKSARERLRFARKPGTKYRAVVIVDDIITTGATARAAFQALGRPRDSEVWCLMDRRPWQGASWLL